MLSLPFKSTGSQLHYFQQRQLVGALPHPQRNAHHAHSTLASLRNDIHRFASNSRTIFHTIDEVGYTPPFAVKFNRSKYFISY
jgi:hypothetical protein